MSPAPPYRHVYVHVPFCARRCSYCDFSIAVRREVPWRAFAASIATECTVRAVASQVRDVQTVYLGGGTPSRLGGIGGAALLSTLRAALPHAWGEHDADDWSRHLEVTLEANPEDVTPEAVAAWRQAGVNRISLGVQTFSEAALAWMHRVHTADRAREAVRILRDGGISSLSIDLIFSLPAQVPRQWADDLDQALALAPEHVSLYGLTVEHGTPLGRWRDRGIVIEADEAQYETDFLLAHDRLQAAGFEHYEVSNFARPGHRARHNSAYWRGVPYLGLGPSAHGFDGTSRRWNTAAFAQWTRQLEQGQDPREGEEALDAGNTTAETVYLGLRTIDGLIVSPEDEAFVSRWIAAGWVICRTDADGHRRLICTPTGWLRMDALAADLTAFRSHS